MPNISWNLSQREVTRAEARFLVEEGLIYDTFDPFEYLHNIPDTNFHVCHDVDWLMVEQALHDYRSENQEVE